MLPHIILKKLGLLNVRAEAQNVQLGKGTPLGWVKQGVLLPPHFIFQLSKFGLPKNGWLVLSLWHSKPNPNNFVLLTSNVREGRKCVKHIDFY